MPCAKASVASYRQSFPNVTILAIVDGTPGVLTNGDSTTLQLAKDLATSLAAQICADSNVDGVFFDLEPTKFGYQGLFTLYQTTSTLLSRKSCQDQNHPNGRYMGVYAYVNTADGNLVKPALGSNGFLAVPLYDVQDSQPPTPTDMNTYHSSVKSYISNSNINSQNYNIPFTVIAPAAASFGEFEQYGTYDTSKTNNFNLISNFYPQIQQVNYLTIVVANTLKYATSPYYMGVDYWAWNYYVSPIPKNNQMLLPSSPNSKTISYLQKNSF